MTCYCDRATKFYPGPHIICGHCFTSRAKVGEHLVFFQAKPNGVHVLKHLKGGPYAPATGPRPHLNFDAWYSYRYSLSDDPYTGETVFRGEV